MTADMGRLRTGIADLDLILGGGLEPGSLVIVAGAPGTGKTILAQQICFANATPEHKALYYTTLSEPHSKLVRHLEPFEFFKPAALGRSVDFIHLGELVQEAGSEGLEPVVSEVVRKCFETKPAVVVIDSAKALRDFVSEHELRAALYGLASRVAHTEAVLLLVGEYTPREIEGGVEFSLADGIVQLAYEPHEPVDRRWLRVVKLGGGGHRPAPHPAPRAGGPPLAARGEAARRPPPGRQTFVSHPAKWLRGVSPAGDAGAQRLYRTRWARRQRHSPPRRVDGRRDESWGGHGRAGTVWRWEDHPRAPFHR